VREEVVAGVKEEEEEEVVVLQVVEIDSELPRLVSLDQPWRVAVKAGLDCIVKIEKLCEMRDVLADAPDPVGDVSS
jgi:hypothetical protein